MKWVVSARFDTLFFVGGAVLAWAFGVVGLFWPALIFPMWVFFLGAVEGPHLAGTWSRTYLDPEARRGKLLWLSLLWLVPGLLAYGLSLATGERLILDGYLGFAAFWSWHHVVRQNYGILSIYQRLAVTPPVWRRLEVWALYGLSWAAFLLFIAAHPINRKLVGLPEPLPGWATTGLQIATLALTALAGVLVAATLWRGMAGRDVRSAAFLCVAALATMVLTHLIIGPREPVTPRSGTPEQSFMLMSLVGGMLHGVQYLGIVLATNRRRYAGKGGLGGLIARAPWRGWLVMVALSLVYVALNAARGGLPQANLFDERSRPGALFLVLYWGVFFNHYYLDQKIWRVGREPRLRAELGLA